jgi:hypothetical protein
MLINMSTPHVSEDMHYGDKLWSAAEYCHNFKNQTSVALQCCLDGYQEEDPAPWSSYYAGVSFSTTAIIGVLRKQP